MYPYISIFYICIPPLVHSQSPPAAPWTGMNNEPEPSHLIAFHSALVSTSLVSTACTLTSECLYCVHPPSLLLAEVFSPNLLFSAVPLPRLFTWIHYSNITLEWECLSVPYVTDNSYPQISYSPPHTPEDF